jgi:hypothetical protein
MSMRLAPRRASMPPVDDNGIDEVPCEHGGIHAGDKRIESGFLQGDLVTGVERPIN